MKGKGIFRGLAKRARQLFKKKPVTKSHPDPILVDPRTRKKKRAHGSGSGRWRSKVPVHRMLPCDPGTIFYHDRLVRHFGRKRADLYGRDIQAGDTHLLPTEEDFRNTPPWGFVKPHV